MANGIVLLIAALQNEEERQQVRRSRRFLRDGSDPMSLPETVFRGIFRLSRQLANDLIAQLVPHMRQSGRPELSIPYNLKVLAALQFYAQGNYQKAVGEDYHFSMSQAAISRCITEVSSVIYENMGNAIHFPRNDYERRAEKVKFMVRGFPGVIGAIDCTHIAIIAPPTDDPQLPGILFYNRKGYYSINVQIICSADLKILAINARYPGSVHDSAIWMTSQTKQHLRTNFEAGDESSWLIGDAGYPLEPWLMTPISDAAIRNMNDEERRRARRYNSTHKSTRNVIERLNGVLKARFRCLLKHRVLHYNPIVASKIIYSCAILHNLCLQRGEHDGNEFDGNENYEDYDNDGGNIRGNDNGNDWLRQGQITRNQLLQNHFN